MPRKPVRFIPGNSDLLKAQAGQSHEATDYSQDIAVATVATGMRGSYRAPNPNDRVNGNVLFRRYVNGMLDYDYACGKIIDALHRVKDSGGHDQLDGLEKTALSVLFPSQFTFIDASMVASTALTNLRLTTEEISVLRQKIAAHLAEEMNWNAGLGGGSVSGRNQTRA